MKVLFITNLFPPYFLGGYEVACKDIVEEFKKNGHSVFVLTSSYGLEKPSVENGIYRTLNANTDFNGYKSIKEKTFSLFYNPSNYKRTLEIIKMVKSDIASVWNISGISVSPLFALQKLKIPYVVHLFDRSLSFVRKNGWKRIINPIIYDRLKLNHIISCSASLKEDYIKRGYDKNSISIIHHGIEPEKEEKKRKKINRKDVKLLFVGQLWEAKGADLAIRALSLLKEKNIFAQLTIIGDGKEAYKSYLRKVAKKEKVESEVHLLGKVSREALKNFYRNNDILLFPTYSWYKEPFGIVILEAMNQGIPVIASNCGGPKEIIIDGESGLLFDSGNAQSLSDKVILLVENLQLYNKIQKNAFCKVKNQFDITLVGKKTIAYCENLLLQ